MSHPYNDAGRGLIAVIIAKQMGLRSIDYCLKKYVPGEVDPSWAELAETLVRGMVQSSSGSVKPPVPKIQ